MAFLVWLDSMLHLFTKKVNCVLLEGIPNTDITLPWNVISLNKTSTFGVAVGH